MPLTLGPVMREAVSVEKLMQDRLEHHVHRHCCRVCCPEFEGFSYISIIEEIRLLDISRKLSAFSSTLAFLWCWRSDGISDYWLRDLHNLLASSITYLLRAIKIEVHLWIKVVFSQCIEWGTWKLVGFFLVEKVSTTITQFRWYHHRQNCKFAWGS